MRRLCFLSLSVLVSNAVPGRALAADDLIELANPVPAIPVTIVPPKFPANAVAPPDGVRVDVTGSVETDGHLEPISVVAAAGYEAYAAAVSDVVKWWRFVPAVDTDACRPRQERVTVTLSFEGSTEKPHVFATLPRAEKPTGKGSLMPRVEKLSTPSMAYPSKLSGIEGQVRVLIEIAPSGDVTSANVLSSTPYGHFDAAVLENARQTKLVWRAPAPSAPVCVQRTYLFCLPYERHLRATFSGCK